MLSIIAASVVLGQTLSPAEEAKKEYDAFIERMAKVESVACTFINSGGPVPPSHHVFRCIKGGIYAEYKANGETHCDGKQTWDYDLARNSYVVQPLSRSSTNYIAFGQTLFPGELKNLTFNKVTDKTVGGYEVRAIDMRWVPNQGKFELYILKKTGMPAGWIWYGNQSNYTTLIKEADYNLKINPETLKWTPPAGAQDKTP